MKNTNIIKNKYFIPILFILLCVAIDQLSKHLIIKSVSQYASIKIFSFFNITNVRNYGISFGFMNNTNHGYITNIIFLVIATSVLLYIIYLYVKSSIKLERFAFLSIIAGAMGNIIDRITTGYVIDFLDFHYKEYHFAAFNVADSLVSLGFIIYIISEFIKNKGGVKTLLLAFIISSCSGSDTIKREELPEKRAKRLNIIKEKFKDENIIPDLVFEDTSK
jgi:signal peptidase II